MISIPCVVPAEAFRKQISFFEFQHKEVYGGNAANKTIIPIVKYNHFGDTPVDDVDPACLDSLLHSNKLCPKHGRFNG